MTTVGRNHQPVARNQCREFGPARKFQPGLTLDEEDEFILILVIPRIRGAGMPSRDNAFDFRIATLGEDIAELIGQFCRDSVKQITWIEFDYRPPRTDVTRNRITPCRPIE